mgnify:CR=1 FL=1
MCCVVGSLCCTGTVGLGFSAWAFLLHRSDHVELAKCCHSKQGDGHCVSAAAWPQDCTACCQVAALSCLLVFATGGFIAVMVPCKATLPLLLSVWVAVARLLRGALSVVCLGCTQSVERLFVRLQWMGYSWTPFLLCVVWVCVALAWVCVKVFAASACVVGVLPGCCCCNAVRAVLHVDVAGILFAAACLAETVLAPCVQLLVGSLQCTFFWLCNTFLLRTKGRDCHWLATHSAFRRTANGLRQTPVSQEVSSATTLTPALTISYPPG